MIYFLYGIGIVALLVVGFVAGAAFISHLVCGDPKTGNFSAKAWGGK